MGDTRRGRVNFFQAWNQAKKLLSNGFTIEQATRLIPLKEHWEPRIDRESFTPTEKDARLGFVKYLIERGVFSDG